MKYIIKYCIYVIFMNDIMTQDLSFSYENIELLLIEYRRTHCLYYRQYDGPK